MEMTTAGGSSSGSTTDGGIAGNIPGLSRGDNGGGAGGQITFFFNIGSVDSFERKVRLWTDVQATSKHYTDVLHY